MKSFGYPSLWFLVSPSKSCIIANLANSNSTQSTQQYFSQAEETSSLGPGSPNQISSYPLSDMVDTEMKDVPVREEEGAPNIGEAVISKSTGKRLQICLWFVWIKKVEQNQEMEVSNQRWIILKKYILLLFFCIGYNNIGSIGYSFFTQITMKDHSST